MKIVLILICVFNVVMWIVFLRHFKNLFSTDDIVSTTKDEINKILADLNHQTERNLSVYENTANRLKALNAETDKKIRLLMDLENKIGTTSKVSEKVNGKSVSATKKTAITAYERNKAKHHLDSEDTVVLTRSGERFSAEPLQTTLFNEKTDYAQNKEENEIASNTEVIVNETGESYAEIPVVSPKVFVPEQPIDLGKSEDDLKTKILKLFDQGYSTETIIKELGCSATEVQFVLSIEGRI